MLIYVRKKDRHMYLEPCTKADIPQSLLDRFETEKAELERKKRGNKFFSNFSQFSYFFHK